MTYLTGRAFDELFTSYEHTAYRLERRESYAGVDIEREPFDRFLAGEPVKITFEGAEDWFANVQAARAAGKRFERVRMVSEPHSDYTRFALAECEINIRGGEEIRYLPRHVGEPAGLPQFDYWLFDSRRLYILHFDGRDNPLGAEPIHDPELIVQANYWRDVAWHYAVPYWQYVGKADVARAEPQP